MTLGKEMEDLVRQALESFVKEITNPSKIGDGECESPIEDDLFRVLSKVANDNVRIWRQRNVDTHIGRFRLDFVVERLGDGMSIGVECDGKDFHSPPDDAERDAAIILTGAVDKVYRITGRDIVFHLEDSIQLLSFMEPWVVSERGATNLANQAHPEALRDDYFGDATPFFPFCAIRLYERPEYEYDKLPDHEFRPTVINVTKRMEEA